MSAWGEMSRLAVDMDIHGYIHGYIHAWIWDLGQTVDNPWILRWHNTVALNLCKIPASYKLLTNCTFLMIISVCFNYLLLRIFTTILERNACVMVVLIWRRTPCCALWNRSGNFTCKPLGSPWEYPWIYPWILPWISTKKSVAMDAKFHIHGKPGWNRKNWHREAIKIVGTNLARLDNNFYAACNIIWTSSISLH